MKIGLFLKYYLNHIFSINYKKLISFSKYEYAIILSLIYEYSVSPNTLHLLVYENLN